MGYSNMIIPGPREFGMGILLMVGSILLMIAAIRFNTHTFNWEYRRVTNALGTAGVGIIVLTFLVIAVL